MAVVYLAEDVFLRRKVALKVLAPGLADDELFRRRFDSESKSAATLDHPNIIPVYAAGDAGGSLYIAMRYVDGGDLRALIEANGPLSLKQATSIVVSVAAALDAAHAQGMVHRDVKPANILIDGRNGQEHYYLSDFGIAKSVSSGRSLTSTGQIVGSIDYIAPEQIQSKPVDGRSDLYALGCVLYQCLSGLVPFPRDGTAAILWAHMHDAPPLVTNRRPELPPPIDDIVAKAMAKQPMDRYATCRELALALRAVASVPDGHYFDRGSAAGAADDSTTSDHLPPLFKPPPGSPNGSSGDTFETRPIPLRGKQPTVNTLRHRPGAADGRATSGQLPPPLKPSPESSYSSSGDGFEPPRTLRFPLRPDFRFVGGSLTRDGPIPFLGNQPTVDTLRHRIQHSSGGALLVTGFTGVGKTTVVDRALAELRASLTSTASAPEPLVIVRLNIARPITPDELMVKLIRNLCEALQEADVFERLAEPIQTALKLAYLRTSQTLKEMRSEASERTNELRVGVGAAAGLPVLQVPTLKLGRMRTRSLQQEETYLLYTLADAEHDFSRIVKELGRCSSLPASRSGWIARRRRSGRHAPWTGRLVIVIDELDKLTAEPSGDICLADLTNALKNVFAASNVHFVVVAGTDIFDLARAAHSRGNSVYDGIFHTKLYTRCLPTGAASALISAVVGEAHPAAHLDSLCDYLEYRSRGVPRLLLDALNELVEWPNGRPFVVVRERDAVRIAFFAGLQRKLATLVTHPSSQDPLSHEIDTDRRRMGAYLIIDWVLLRGNTTFSAADLSHDDPASRPDPQIVSDELARELLEALASSRVGILERLDIDHSDRTIVDFHQSNEPVYRLAVTAVAAAKDNGEVPGNLGKVGDGRYVLLEELDRGALGRTYRAFDEQQQDAVTIKLLDIPELVTDDQARQRFLRRAELAYGLSHPGLIRTQAVLKEPDGVLGIVMDYIDGPSLDQVFRQGPLPPAMVASIAREILTVFGYLTEHDVVRLDLRPSSITLLEGKRPVITDLGFARRLEESEADRLTAVGTVLGSPRYAAPEQLRGEVVDIRADLYSLGLMLYEAITGRRARSGDGREVLHAAKSERIEVCGLACSQELREIVGRLLEFDREHRFDNPQAAAAALSATPEAREVE